ncbi:MAG: hypothetical protein AAF252_01695 [Pseudomonadota bacterium]
MFDNFFQGLIVLSDLFFAYPIPFTIGTVVVFALIYYKWVWIGRAHTKAIKNAYAGWKVDGSVDTAQRLVMRPVKMLSVGLWTLLFFGGGFLFFALVVVPKGDVEPTDWFALVAFGLFSIAAMFLILMSFTRITFDGEVFTRSGVFGRNMAVRADALKDVSPISKTIAGGIYLDFGTEGRIRVTAQMSGYRQLLEILTQHNPKLRMLVNAYSDAAKRQL